MVTQRAGVLGRSEKQKENSAKVFHDASHLKIHETKKRWAQNEINVQTELARPREFTQQTTACVRLIKVCPATDGIDIQQNIAQVGQIYR